MSEPIGDEHDALEEVAASHLQLAHFLATGLPRAERDRARRLLEDLATAHRRTPVLARGVLLAQEKLGDAEEAAAEMFDAAAEAPWDEAAAECALAMALASEKARQMEREATELWVDHRLRVKRMLDDTAALLGADVEVTGRGGEWRLSPGRPANR